MKIQKLLLPILILSLFFTGTVVQGQSKSEKEKEEKILELEKKLQEALKQREVELEKALEESKKYQDEELKKILEDQKKVKKKALEQYRKAWELNPEEFERNWDDARDFYDQKHVERLYGDQNYRIFHPDLDFDFDVEALKGIGGLYLSSSAKDRTALTISKDLDDITFDTKFKYDVTEGARGINFKVNGSMHQGTLLISLLKPGGEVLQEIEISPLADVSWNQDLRWEEDEDLKENLGTWLIVVSAKGASGHYSVNVRAN